MIAEIIIAIFFILSIGGFIFAFKHYLKHHKEKRDNKRILKALETYDNPEAKNDNYYKSGIAIVFEWIEDNIGWGKIIKWSFIIFVCFMTYNVFFKGTFDSPTTNTIVPSPSTDGPDNNQNQTTLNQTATFMGTIKSIFPEGTPGWLIFIAFAFPVIIAWKFIRGSRYDF